MTLVEERAAYITYKDLLKFVGNFNFPLQEDIVSRDSSVNILPKDDLEILTYHQLKTMALTDITQQRAIVHVTL